MEKSTAGKKQDKNGTKKGKNGWRGEAGKRGGERKRKRKRAAIRYRD